MPLILTATNNKQAALLNDKTNYSFGPQGGSFGRSENNDWTLPDPQRYISSKHGSISRDDLGYMVTDNSTNGIYINSSRRAVGKGNQARLHDGDLMHCGEYELKVSIKPDAQDQPKQLDPSNSLDVMFDNSDERMQAETEKLNQMLVGSNTGDILDFAVEPPAAKPVQTAEQQYTNDPLAHLDGKAAAIDSLDDLNLQPGQTQPATQQDTTGLMQEPFIPADVVSGPKQRLAERSTPNNPIPDNAEFGSSARNRTTSESPNLGNADPAQTERFQASQESNHQSAEESLSIIFSAMGLPVPAVNSASANLILKEIGQMTRIAINGTIAVMQARKALQNDFGTAADRMRPVEDNPLRTSIDPQDAMQKLFNTEQRNCLKPSEAMREAMEDIGDHQLAMLAGLKAAYSAVMPVFEPEGLVKRFERYGYSNETDGDKTAWYWEMYEHYYEELTQQDSTGLGRLFGDMFKHAYDQQARTSAELRMNPHRSPGAAAAAEIIGDLISPHR